MELKIAYQKLPKNFDIEISVDWSNQNEEFWQGWVPSVRKDFKKISKVIEKKIKSFFIDNAIMPFKGLNFEFGAYNTYWQFEVDYISVDDESKPPFLEDNFTFVKFVVMVVCHCADIKEEHLEKLIPMEKLAESRERHAREEAAKLKKSSKETIN